MRYTLTLWYTLDELIKAGKFETYCEAYGLNIYNQEELTTEVEVTLAQAVALKLIDRMEISIQPFSGDGWRPGSITDSLEVRGSWDPVKLEGKLVKNPPDVGLHVGKTEDQTYKL